MTRCTQQLQRDWNHAKEILDLTMNKIAWLHFVNVNCVCEELCQITTNDVARSWIAISFFSCFYIKFHSKPIIRVYLIIILACNKQTKDLRIDLQLYFLMRWALANIWDCTIWLWNFQLNVYENINLIQYHVILVWHFQIFMSGYHYRVK